MSHVLNHLYWLDTGADTDTGRPPLVLLHGGFVDHRMQLMIPVAGTWERATKIDVPVLAINGALDSPDHLAMAERLAGGVPRGRAISIDGAAHYPNMERPEGFNRLLGDFLRTLT